MRQFVVRMQKRFLWPRLFSNNVYVHTAAPVSTATTMGAVAVVSNAKLCNANCGKMARHQSIRNSAQSNSVWIGPCFCLVDFVPLNVSIRISVQFVVLFLSNRLARTARMCKSFKSKLWNSSTVVVDHVGSFALFIVAMIGLTFKWPSTLSNTHERTTLRVATINSCCSTHSTIQHQAFQFQLSHRTRSDGFWQAMWPHLLHIVHNRRPRRISYFMPQHRIGAAKTQKPKQFVAWLMPELNQSTRMKWTIWRMAKNRINKQKRIDPFVFIAVCGLRSKHHIISFYHR